MAHSPQVAEGANAYLTVFLLVMLAESVSGVLTSHFNGCGRTIVSFYSFLVSAPANVLISLIRLIYLAVVFYHSHRFFRDVKGWVQQSLPIASVDQLRFSWPIAATFVSMTLSSQVCMAIYANMNVYQFAAITLITPWVRIAGQLSYTWTQAAGIFIAQLLGKSLSSADLDSFLSRAWRGAFVAAAIVAVIYALIIFSTRWIYSDLADETRMALLSFLPVLLIVPFPRASNSICLSVFWVFTLFLFEELVKFPFFHKRIWSKQWHSLHPSTPK